MTHDRIQELAQKKSGLDPGWIWITAEWVGEPGPDRVLKVTGERYATVAEPFDLDSPSTETRRTVFITRAEIEAFEREREETR